MEALELPLLIVLDIHYFLNQAGGLLSNGLFMNMSSILRVCTFHLLISLSKTAEANIVSISVTLLTFQAPILLLKIE